MSTGIEWTDETWNPTTGCDQVSPGCDHCYALTMAKRLKGMGSKDYQNDGDAKTSGPGFAATMHPHRLDQPLRWKRPRRIFVNSMSDLFHEAISDDFIAHTFAVMALAPHHSFQVLTKRHGRMRSLLNSMRFQIQVDTLQYQAACGEVDEIPEALAYKAREAWRKLDGSIDQRWPLPNVWLGVSVEDQTWADIRIPALLDTPAEVRFLSCEPLLGPIDLVDPLAEWAGPSVAVQINQHLHWVIVGGESGPDSRPMHPDWARSIRDQCNSAGVAFHFKQWGEWTPAQERPTHGDLWLSGDGVNTQPWQPGDRGAEPGRWHQYGDVPLRRVGKHAAGRELDGRTWDEYPDLVTA